MHQPITLKTHAARVTVSRLFTQAPPSLSSPAPRSSAPVAPSSTTTQRQVTTLSLRWSCRPRPLPAVALPTIRWCCDHVTWSAPSPTSGGAAEESPDHEPNTRAEGALCDWSAAPLCWEPLQETPTSLIFIVTPPLRAGGGGAHLSCCDDLHHGPPTAEFQH